MQPDRLDKLRAHSEHLLDLFVGLREKYALLDPMAFHGETIDTYGTGDRARGFNILKNTLGMSCVLDLAKIAWDPDDRTPAIARLVNALNEPELVGQLREAYAVHRAAPIPHEAFEQAALIGFERAEEATRRVEFADLLDELAEKFH